MTNRATATATLELPGQRPDRRADIGATLETARSQVETRFLEGGTVLLSVMDVLNKLLSALDQIAKALDAGNGGDAGADISATVASLNNLQAVETERQAALVSLSGIGMDLRRHVSDMQETMRYLRTFAVTAKITGAGLPDFAGFAQEILERIFSGTAEVDGFAGHLDSLANQVAQALEIGKTLASSYGRTVPGVAKALADDAKAIAGHRQQLGEIAREVGTIARAVQSKMSATLSALQVGDITRQRIEHVQTTLDLFAAFLKDEGAGLTPDQRDRLENVVLHLTAQQMAETCADFERDSENVVRTIASFGDDTDRILSLRDRMGSSEDGNFIRDLEDSVSVAQRIVQQVEAAAGEADRVSQSTLQTAAALLQSIGNIRVVKTDIHYMALNTNLRCSRLGEEGKSINVVTAELRIFAGKLEDSAEAINSGLPLLEAAAGRIAPSGDSQPEGLGQRLEAAVGSIHAAAETMEQELDLLSTHGRDMAEKIRLLTSTLDFKRDLGEILFEAGAVLAGAAGDDIADISDIAEAIGPLDARIFKIYTMSQERSVHRTILAGPAIETSPEPAKPADDEDLFADALF